MSNDEIYTITVQAQDITPGQALLVNATGVAPWIGPMIHDVTTEGDTVTLRTVNGGETTRKVGEWVQVVDVLTPEATEAAGLTLVTRIETTLWFVGNDQAHALGRMPFDSYESADDYRNDEEDPASVHIYSATATVDMSTVSEVNAGDAWVG